MAVADDSSLSNRFLHLSSAGCLDKPTKYVCCSVLRNIWHDSADLFAFSDLHENADKNTRILLGKALRKIKKTITTSGAPMEFARFCLVTAQAFAYIFRYPLTPHIELFGKLGAWLKPAESIQFVLLRFTLLSWYKQSIGCRHRRLGLCLIILHCIADEPLKLVWNIPTTADKSSDGQKGRVSAAVSSN